VYWGGAVVALLADVEARRRTRGARGLEDALRSILANGWDATHVIRVDAAIRMVDDAIGTPVLAPLAAKYADHGSPLALDPVLSDLGVERHDGGVRLHSDAPLAAYRKAILFGRGTP
jgi:predicted metalloprotease with PDZ domain